MFNQISTWNVGNQWKKRDGDCLIIYEEKEMENEIASWLEGVNKE